MSDRIWAGIDPGVTGALAVIYPDGIIEFFDTPVYEDGKRTRIDVSGAVDLLSRLLGIAGDVMVTIEKVQPMPHIGGKAGGKAGAKGSAGHGSIAAFSIGYSLGIWLGILATMQLPYKMIPPVTWKKAMLAGAPKEKDASRIEAIRMFPQTQDLLKLKKHHGRADALLLAEYGRRVWSGGMLDKAGTSQ